MSEELIESGRIVGYQSVTSRLTKKMSVKFNKDPEEKAFDQNVQKSQFIRSTSRGDKSPTKLALQDMTPQLSRANSSKMFSQAVNIPPMFKDNGFFQRKKTFEVFVKEGDRVLNKNDSTKSNLIEKISKKSNQVFLLQNPQCVDKKKNEDIIYQEYKKLDQKRSKGVILTNELWSEKYYDYIIKRSKVKNDLDQFISRKKLDPTQNLVQNFDNYFMDKYMKTQDDEEAIFQNYQQKNSVNISEFLLQNQRSNSKDKQSNQQKQILLDLQKVNMVTPHSIPNNFKSSSMTSRAISPFHRYSNFKGNNSIQSSKEQTPRLNENQSHRRIKSIGDSNGQSDYNQLINSQKQNDSNLIKDLQNKFQKLNNSKVKDTQNNSMKQNRLNIVKKLQMQNLKYKENHLNLLNKIKQQNNQNLQDTPDLINGQKLQDNLELQDKQKQQEIKGQNNNQGQQNSQEKQKNIIDINQIALQNSINLQNINNAQNAINFQNIKDVQNINNIQDDFFSNLKQNFHKKSSSSQNDKKLQFENKEEDLAISFVNSIDNLSFITRQESGKKQRISQMNLFNQQSSDRNIYKRRAQSQYTQQQQQQQQVEYQPTLYEEIQSEVQSKDSMVKKNNYATLDFYLKIIKQIDEKKFEQTDKEMMREQSVKNDLLKASQQLKHQRSQSQDISRRNRYAFKAESPYSIQNCNYFLYIIKFVQYILTVFSQSQKQIFLLSNQKYFILNPKINNHNQNKQIKKSPILIQLNFIKLKVSNNYSLRQNMRVSTQQTLYDEEKGSMQVLQTQPSARKFTEISQRDPSIPKEMLISGMDKLIKTCEEFHHENLNVMAVIDKAKDIKNKKRILRQEKKKQEGIINTLNILIERKEKEKKMQDPRQRFIKNKKSKPIQFFEED